LLPIDTRDREPLFPRESCDIPPSENDPPSVLDRRFLAPINDRDEPSRITAERVKVARVTGKLSGTEVGARLILVPPILSGVEQRMTS